ncbi:MAG: hypothetical protein NT049_18660 [Planctomycetota bacterium]|nr:hypothetical protein [Planctomycetota bacterium]
MKTFTDSQGRSWSVVVNVSAIKRVRHALDVNLLDVAGGDLLSRLAGDPCLLVDVLYVLCKAETDAKGVGDEDFGRAMVGGALDAASSALMEELLDFFPSALRIGALKKMVLGASEALATATEAARTMQPLIEAAKTPRQEAGRLGGSSGASPASSEPTPAT